jgi:hypothetical protein
MSNFALVKNSFDWIGIDISPTVCRVMAKLLTVQEILDEHIAKKLV